MLRTQSSRQTDTTLLLVLTELVLVPLLFYRFHAVIRKIRDLDCAFESGFNSDSAGDFDPSLMPTMDDDLFDQQAQLELTAQNLSDVNQLLQQASHRFEELFQSLPVACFCYDCEGRIFEWNRASESQYGLLFEDAFQRTIWEAICLPEDAARVQDMTRRVFAGEAFHAVELEHHRKDGSRCLVMCSSFPLRGADGEIVGAISTNADISDLKKAQEHLRESEERFRSAIQSMQEGLILIDADLTIRLSNGGADQIFGAEDRKLTGRKITTLGWTFVTEDGLPIESDQWPMCVSLDNGQPQHEIVQGFNHPNGKLIWLQINCAPLVRSAGEKPYAVVATLTNITQRKHYEQKLKEQMVMLNEAQVKLELQQAELLEANVKLQALATLDGLTGLKNHRAFQERLDAEFQRSQRYGIPLSLILLDVDKFKTYNDTYGHPAGDEVLKTVAKILQREARITDLVARYGGEEFAIILTNTEAEGALVVAERMRTAFERAEWKERLVTASFGVTTVDSFATTTAELIAASDRALYSSKANGRNRVTHTTSLTGESNENRNLAASLPRAA